MSAWTNLIDRIFGTSDSSDMSKGISSLVYVPQYDAKYSLGVVPKQQPEPLSFEAWKELEKQTSVNKDENLAKAIKSELPSLHKYTSAEHALRNPGLAYNDAYNYLYNKNFNPEWGKESSSNQMSRLKVATGKEAIMDTIRDLFKKSGQKDTLAFLKDQAGIDVPVTISKEPLSADSTVLGQYRSFPNKQVLIDPGHVDFNYKDAIADTVMHELKHAQIDKLYPEYPGAFEGFYSRKSRMNTGYPKSMIDKNASRDLAYEYSGDHFNNVYAVPSIDVAAENIINKIKGIGKEKGYTEYDPSKDPRFKNNKDLVRIMKWLGSKNK